ncbi:MAG TPA: M17 family metallopeptidase, partial [Actinomycetales bacterium]|nr:M17 family metallopeptidase [Actinomycetales bacterium]
GRHPQQAVALAQAAARATLRTRALTAAPANIKNPQWFVSQAQTLAQQVGLTTEVWDQERLEAEGFGGILAVGAASKNQPRFMTLNYEPEETQREHVVMVGKGITYDTGGLSIKPRQSMVAMKTDMAGAAAVLGAIMGAAELRVAQRITAVIPLAENAVGASAYRPGDVVRVYGGRTVEIANTDAEGRMILADALAWADENLNPDIMIDVATLTGAATLGLGRQHAAAYGTNPELIAQLEVAGQQTGEKIWHMPLVAEYREAVSSRIAELRHVPDAEHRFSAGSITAALFLREFIGEREWVHLDIAGPARSPAAKHEIPEGATGYGARLLLRWLENAS